MKRVLITGVHGFTGRYLASQLSSAGHEVHGLARYAGEDEVPGVTAMHVAALGDSATLARVMAAVQPERVVHLAAIAFVAHGNADEMYHTNLVGSRHLLQALIEGGSQPEAVLLASSANIYGNQREGVLDEDAPPAPANDYGVSKLAMEYMARLYGRQLPIILVRPFNYTGVGQSLNFVIPKIVDHVRRRSARIELGNLDVARDFSDVRAVVDSYMRLLDHPEAAGKIFNICSGQAYTLHSILEMVREISGHDFEVSVNPAFVRANEVRSLCGSRARLESVIGPLAMPPLKETLRWMLEA